MNAKTIQDIVKWAVKVGSSDLPAFVSEAICNAQSIRSQISGLHKQIAEETKKFNAGIKSLQSEIRTVQQSCNHQSSSYYGDAAGGSDSYFECDICGYQARRL